MAENEKTPFEREIDAVSSITPADVLTHRAPLSYYCGNCGARNHRCWCGSSRLMYRSETRDQRR